MGKTRQANNTDIVNINGQGGYKVIIRVESTILGDTNNNQIIEKCWLTSHTGPNVLLKENANGQLKWYEYETRVQINNTDDV